MAVTDGAGFRSTRLDALEAVPWKDGMTLRPLRSPLGIRAFGCAGFSAAAGDVVVEQHRESVDGRGHQELYFVAQGHATFTLDGRELDAAAGTFVFVEDPGVERAAIATVDDTLVLVFGGEPTFTPGADELIARVRARVARGEVADAVALARSGVDEEPESPGAKYALALALAANGNTDEARPLLAHAVQHVPQLAAEARTDVPLRDLL